MHLSIKRIYAAPSSSDGTRILVDRLWPRGLTKLDARIDLWLKDAAPSTDLRQWFAHEPARWETFQARYLEELSSHPERVAPILEHARVEATTLLYSAKDETRNQAVVLARFVRSL